MIVDLIFFLELQENNLATLAFYCFAGILFILYFQSFCAFVFQFVPYHQHRAQLLSLSFMGAKANERMFTEENTVRLLAAYLLVTTQINLTCGALNRTKVSPKTVKKTLRRHRLIQHFFFFFNWNYISCSLLT